MRFGYDGSNIIVPFPVPVADNGIATSLSDPLKLREEAISIAKSIIDMERKVGFDRNPVTSNLSPFVLDSSKKHTF